MRRVIDNQVNPRTSGAFLFIVCVENIELCKAFAYANIDHPHNLFGIGAMA